MKRYAGDRTIDGVKVTVDGAPLDPCTNVREFSKNGFECDVLLLCKALVTAYNGVNDLAWRGWDSHNF